MRSLLAPALLAAAALLLLGPGLSPAQSPRPIVLVVMSYHEDFAWSREIKQGIDEVLLESCNLVFAYLDTKLHPENGEANARQVLALYERLAPDGVIAADDNAQSLFVVPYLKDATTTPVVFCGVNAQPEAYGYPASNVTGVLERFLVCDSLALLKELAPDVTRVAFLMRGDMTTTTLLYAQIGADMPGCDATAVAYAQPETLEQAEAEAKRLAEESDALFLEHVEGLPDHNGDPLPNAEAVSAILAAYGPKPTVCGADFTVQDGVLCAVVDSGRTQGAMAASMLLRILGGAAVADLPVTRNTQGLRLVNARTLEALGLTAAPGADVELRGAP